MIAPGEFAADQAGKDVPDDLAEEVVHRVAEEWRGLAVDVGEPPSAVHGDESVGDALEDGRCLVVPLGLHTLRDIDACRNDEEHVAGLVLDGHAGKLDDALSELFAQ